MKQDLVHFKCSELYGGPPPFQGPPPGLFLIKLIMIIILLNYSVQFISVHVCIIVYISTYMYVHVCVHVCAFSERRTSPV